ncbi:pentapeptide repeat-containing protein [Pseudovibrio exalbescens]|uniref:pentapeptide repeat-containing protein n=1 Tax=Pseudovibrio exalbescens TaxID=197461 RepID=UPI0023651E86|nr:pentapeptide repeat-containing protein [Pseudovibrio exalbescens]MDD7910843.1 pentapeptide repeat-containing protein [Pseudovibrio exalbescens]
MVWRAVVAQKQADTAEQSHITDQINKAVAGLGAERTVDRIGRPIKIVDRVGLIETERTEIEWQGKPLELNEEEEVTERGDWQVFSETLPNLEVRIGSIYALERIAQDSLRDHIQIMEILTAYIRENGPAGKLEARSILMPLPKPRTDIQAAIDVIGRRTDEQVKVEWEKKYRLDLRETNLSGANFKGGKFEGALFNGSDLQNCRFGNAKLKAVRMRGCMLNYAEFREADLTGAVLDGVKITALQGLNDSYYAAAEAKGLTVAGADISAIRFFRNEDSVNPTLGSRDTILHGNIELKRDQHSEDMEKFFYLKHDRRIDDEKGVLSRLQTAGLLYWSRFDWRDAATAIMMQKLWDDLGLKGFPYED